MNALPAATFAVCFTAWVDSLRESDPDIVAMDGKTSRRAHRGAAHPLHLVSAWASRQRIVLGQESMASKSSEITAIPLLLERLELTGALVTIDAMDCRRDIARAIRARGADYLLALKDNWPTLAQHVRLFFDTAPASAFDMHETTDGDHGRIAVRRHRLTRDVAWLTTDRRFPGEPRFPDLATIGLVEAEVERDGRTTRARRFFLSSAPLSAAFLARAVRAHWGIENRFHRVMDVVFHDDLMRLRTEHGPANMATVRHVALDLLQAVPGKKASPSNKRLQGGTTTSCSMQSSKPLNDLQAIPCTAPSSRAKRGDPRSAGSGPKAESIATSLRASRRRRDTAGDYDLARPTPLTAAPACPRARGRASRRR